MTANELIEAGQLTAAVDALGDTLRRAPRDAVARASLFTLLCLAGRWDRAVQQLDAMEPLRDSRSTAIVDPQRYRSLLATELLRQRYFAEGLAPKTFGEPDVAVQTTLTIGRLVAAGEYDQARQLFDQFDGNRPALAGRLGGEPFADFQDAEDWMSPVLEVLAPEGYFWVGWGEVQFLDVIPPRSLIDLAWAPARLGLNSGVIGAVALPGLYSTSWNHPDELVRLGRRNDWIDLGAGLIRGAGVKVYQVGDRDKALVELQDLTFDLPIAGEIALPSGIDA
jgi:type VI secretion system protein ImpE